MSKNTFAVADTSSQVLQKSKPRYTDAENKLLFESWWSPQRRRELSGRLGREMNALRSQFCRLLKEKGLSNQDYYNMMKSRNSGENGNFSGKGIGELETADRIVFETFCKHQALGNSRTQACEELLKKPGFQSTPAALKLRFYRLVKKLQYSDEDLHKIGQELLNQPVVIPQSPPESKATATIRIVKNDDFIAPQSIQQQASLPDQSFFYQLSSIPESIRNHEERIIKIEEQQRHQLDLRGFIEHLLAVERDIKREDKLMEEIQKLMDENEITHRNMEKERERLKKRELELSDVYKILENTLSDFMRLESVPKLASLGDFMHRLEITVDQFGNVLKSKRIVS
jgi:hypothetical protein